MSDLLNDVGHCMKEECNACSAIRTLLIPRVADVGGISVRRMLPADALKSVGPFVFFDHLGPAILEPGRGIDVPPHPHIGLATVTYLFEGEILHRDSLGGVQPIRPGAINWMTAGRGIAHSERTPPLVRETGGALHALQMWVALPEAEEETAPAFFHHKAADLPSVEVDGAKVRVMIGEAFGVVSPVKTFSPTIYLEARLEQGREFKLPDGAEERGVYVVSGALQARGTTIAQHSLALFSPEPNLKVTALEDTTLVLIGGAPLGKRYVWWNLVASRRELIDRGKQEWREGKYPIPGEHERTRLPGDPSATPVQKETPSPS